MPNVCGSLPGVPTSAGGFSSSSMSQTGLSSVRKGRVGGNEGGLRGGIFLEVVLWDCESDSELVAWFRKGLSNAFLMLFTLT